MSELGKLDAPLLEERDHPLRPWLLALGLLVAVLVVAGVFYYSPLTAGGLMRCPDEAERIPATETEDGPTGGERCLVTYAPETAVTFGASIRNEGPLPVTVTGLAFDAPTRDLLDVTALRAGATPDDLAVFAPFALSRGEERYMEVEAALLPCSPRQEGRLVSLPDLPVRTRFAFVSRTTLVPLADEVSVLLTGCDA